MTVSTLSSSSTGPRMSCGQPRPVASIPGVDSTAHSDSEEFEDYPGPQKIGVPGAPGAADLEVALRRLTPAEVLTRRACLSTGTGYSYDYDAGMTFTFHFRTSWFVEISDSIMSTGSSGNLSGYGGNTWRVPEKLQIVKPIEGISNFTSLDSISYTYTRWSFRRTARSKNKRSRGLEDLGLVTFTLSDLEEDEEYTNPGKIFKIQVPYIRLPIVLFFILMITEMSLQVLWIVLLKTAPSSALNSGMSTPSTLSRKNSTSTFNIFNNPWTCKNVKRKRYKSCITFFINAEWREELYAHCNTL